MRFYKDMISIFALAQQLLQEAKSQHKTLAEVDIAPVLPQGGDRRLSEAFAFARGREHQWIRRLEHERPDGSFENLRRFFHKYELPRQEEFLDETRVAEAQMDWGAQQLIHHVCERHIAPGFNRASKRLPYRRLDRALDRLQKLCAISEINDFRVASLRTRFDLSTVMTSAEAAEVIDTYNGILGVAYGLGPEKMLVSDRGMPRETGRSLHDVYEVIRIEKFDRLRQNKKLIRAHVELQG